MSIYICYGNNGNCFLGKRNEAHHTDDYYACVNPCSLYTACHFGFTGTLKSNSL